MSTSMTIALYVGVLLLLLLSIQDFRSKINKRGRIGQYYTCMSLFVVFNLTVYILLCNLLSGVSCRDLLFGGQGQAVLSPDKKMLPLLLAFAYFGVGSVDIPLGGKVVSFYGALLKLFQGMYTPEGIDIDPIADNIKQLTTQSDQLREAVESFNDVGKDHGWNTLADKWQDLTQDQQGLEAHVESLRLIQDELCGDLPVDTRKLNKLISEKLGKITEEINKKLKRHIYVLVEANAQNALAVQKLLSAIGLALPPTPARADGGVHLSRAITFSLFGGALLGIVVASLDSKNHQLNFEIIRYMLTLGVFGAIFSFVARVPKNSFHWALALSGAAGFAGYLVYVCAEIFAGTIQAIDNPKFSLSELKWLLNSIFGFFLGALLGLTTYSFRYIVRPRVFSCALCYLIIAISGALVFLLFDYMLYQNGIVEKMDMENIIYFLLVGAFAAVVSAFITNIFHEPFAE